MKKVITLTLCLALLFAVCIPANAEVAQKNSFTMYSCYVEAEVAGLVELFTQETGIEVKYVRLSAGEMQARVAAETAMRTGLRKKAWNRRPAGMTC